MADVTIYSGISDDAAPASPKEQELWDWMDNASSESDRVRIEEANFDNLDKWLEIYSGKHWATAMPSHKPAVVVNELRTLILSEASDLSEMDPRIYVLKDPRVGGRDIEVERGIRAIWAREEVNLRLLEAACWALICGTGFVRPQWDPDLYHGLGDISVGSVDPRWVLPDPDATDDRKWQFVIVEQVMDIADIRRMFPVRGALVKPEDKWSTREKLGRNTDRISWGAYSGPMSEDGLVGRSVYGYKKARARVLDCFVRDYSVEKIVQPKTDPTTGLPMRDENGSEVFEEVVKAKFPGGRRIIGANGTILFDGPNPYGNNDFGIVRVVLEPSLSSFWGRGFVQQTVELQLAADKLMSAVVENAIRLNNGIVVATTNTGVDWESFASLPGQIVTINPGSTFDIKYPNPMPPDMVQAPWQMLDMQRRILGFPDARAGNSGKGNVSPELTETEISQAQSTTRLRGRMLYHSVRRLAEIIFSLMARNYVIPRTIPAVEGEAFKPVTWKPLDNPDKYQIYVDPASFQVMSRTMLRRLSLALFRLRGIDRSSLLESLGWPDWEGVAKRMDAAEQAAAKAKALGKRNG